MYSTENLLNASAICDNDDDGDDDDDDDDDDFDQNGDCCSHRSGNDVEDNITHCHFSEWYGD